MRYSLVVDMPARTKHDRQTGSLRIISPPTRVKLYVEIDLDAVAKELGSKAWRNKSKKAAAMYGAIRCKAHALKVLG